MKRRFHFPSLKNWPVGRTVLLLVLAVGGIAETSAQVTPAIEWEVNLGGSKKDEASSIKQTSDGGYIIASETSSNDFDVSGNHGKSDLWIVKLSSTGAIEWQRCLGGSSPDVAKDVEEDVDHGFVVVGSAGSHDGDVTSSLGGLDVWLVKLDSAGNILWDRTYGGSSDDAPYDLVLLNDGRMLIVGFSKSSDHDVTSNYGDFDEWIFMVGSDLEIEWSKSYGGSARDIATKAVMDFDGNFIVGGHTQSNDFDVSGNHSDLRDFWVLKLNPQGDLLWQKCFGGSGHETGSGLVLTNDNGAVLCGNTQSYDGDVVGVHDSIDDFWMFRINTLGELQWQKCIGGTKDDCALALTSTYDNGFVLSGHAFSQDDGDITGHDGGADFWQVKTDSEGNIEWQLCIGGTNGALGDYPFDIIQSNDGGFVVAGHSDADDNDVGDNNGEFDLWIVKLTCDLPGMFYPDVDGDLFGNENYPTTACVAPAGFVTDHTDCDDNNASAYPGATEIAGNEVDDDCNGKIDEVFTTVGGPINIDFSLPTNPNSGLLKMEFYSEHLQNVTISIVDLLGNTLRTQNLGKMQGSYSAQIHISELPSAVYILRIEHNGSSEVRRIVVQK